jgi:tetratricopeptide (TPR) repeat protein
MPLTKRQKKYFLENCGFLTLKELSIKSGITELEIEKYLKLNKKKILLDSDVNASGFITKKRKECLNKNDDDKNTAIKTNFIKIIKENWLFLLLLCLGITILYLNSLRGDFVSDDYATIPQEPMIKNFSFMVEYLPKFTNYLIAGVFGVGSPVPYHVFNLLVYLMLCVVGFVFSKLVFGDLVAKLGIIIFSIMPIHVETVSWISGKPYTIYSLFLLLSLSFLILYLKTKNIKNLIYTFLYLGLTIYSEKVRALGFIFIAFLLFISFKDELRINKDLLKKIAMYGTIGTIILVIAIWPFIKNRIDSVNSGYNLSESIYYNPFFQYPTSMAKYLQLMLVPTDLTLYHTMYILPVWLNWAILLTYLSGLIYFFFKDKKIFFALSFIFAATAPSMAPVKVSWLVAERYALLGSLGFAMFLGIILEKIEKKHLFVSVSLLAIIICFYSTRTFLRNIDWQTNHKLWVSTVQVSPNSHNAWNNIGDDYDKLGQYENAIKGFTQSTIVKPNYADAYHNRANIFFKANRLDLARDSYITALKYSPGLYQTYFSLTQIDLMEKRLDLAYEHASAVVKIQPNIPQTHYTLAVVLAQMGKLDESVKELQISLQLNPEFKVAKDLLNNIKSQTNPKK